MKKIMCFIFMLIVYQNICYAADWIWVSSSDDVSVFIDSQSIYLEHEKSNSNIAFLDGWTKFEYLEPQDDGAKTKLIEYRFKLVDQVKNAWFSVSTYLSYDVNGELIKSNHYQGDEWQKVPPESMIQAVCWRAIECIENKYKRNRKG